ncbi:hypothetical protein [Streptosporangium sp. NPDC048865]|uniref:hypothetical protein n=1 Tax=Streptosporangium sp. NPDC048865 TaxID=3155766 RepID=UPI00342E46D2
MIAVFDRSGKRAIGVIAETKKRGGPLAARGAAVAIATVRDEARSGRAGGGAGDDLASPPGGERVGDNAAGVGDGGIEGGTTGRGDVVSGEGAETRSGSGALSQPPADISASTTPAVTRTARADMH